MAAGVMRTIDKYMGFDNYIVLANPKCLEGLGMQLKTRMLDKLRSEPSLGPEDFLNVSPECWQYLEKFDEKEKMKQEAADKEAQEDELRLIEEEAEWMQYRKDRAEAIESGSKPPKPPQKKKVKKSLKQHCIDTRIAKREAVEARKRRVAADQAWN
eukprot:CAMPEP_0197517078 /NCGR_PEP_ID=MMETSP1318-20131121/2043_1 /TAXON_ID=552666 /ORGANISM="Partenskyella glossopodia, Strain RCC365" /LENGTH=155 /DNA_ID=CAMNT_0043066343 /DNA_START=188 /DNA_END=654 /DNA_ORIENTATION=+